MLEHLHAIMLMLQVLIKLLFVENVILMQVMRLTLILLLVAQVVLH